MKLIDLTIPLGIGTPPWPTYEPLQVKYFKRLAPNGANGQLLTHSNHLGTHLDGEIHFHTPGKDIASLELNDFLVGPGVVVDLSDCVGDYQIYTAQMIEDRVEVREGDTPWGRHHPHRLPPFRLGPAPSAADEVRYMAYGAPRPRPGVCRVVQGKKDRADRRRLWQRRLSHACTGVPWPTARTGQHK